MRICDISRGVATGGDQGGCMPPPSLISEPNKVQQSQFQTSRILLFTGVQKYTNQKFHGFTVYATIFGQFTVAFHFF